METNIWERIPFLLLTNPHFMIKSEIIKEAKRIEEDAIHSAKGHFNASMYWRRIHFWIGIPATICAAIAGASALAAFQYHEVIAGVLSIVATILSALATFINPNQKAEIHQTSGTYFSALKNKIRLFYNIEIAQLDDLKATREIKKYGNERDDLNKKSPEISTRAFNKAKNGIDQGEATYAIDKWSNITLPHSNSSANP